MGEAKRRGTLEQRIAQSVERRKVEDAARSVEFKRREAERLAKLPPQERKDVILAGGGGRHHSRMMLAAALAASAPLLIVNPTRKR